MLRFTKALIERLLSDTYQGEFSGALTAAGLDGTLEITKALHNLIQY